jgi:hypothetical protein
MTNVYIVHIDNTPGHIEGVFLNKTDAEQLAKSINYELSTNTYNKHKAYVQEMFLTESSTYEDEQILVNTVCKEFKGNIPVEGTENTLLALPKDTPNNGSKTMYGVIYCYLRQEGDYNLTEDILISFANLKDAKYYQQHCCNLYPNSDEYIYIEEIGFGPESSQSTILINRYSFLNSFLADSEDTKGFSHCIKDVAILPTDINSVAEYDCWISLYANTEEEAHQKFNKYKEGLIEE